MHLHSISEILSKTKLDVCSHLDLFALKKEMPVYHTIFHKKYYVRARDGGHTILRSITKKKLNQLIVSYNGAY